MIIGYIQVLYLFRKILSSVDYFFDPFYIRDFTRQYVNSAKSRIQLLDESEFQEFRTLLDRYVSRIFLMKKSLDSRWLIYIGIILILTKNEIILIGNL